MVILSIRAHVLATSATEHGTMTLGSGTVFGELGHAPPTFPRLRAWPHLVSKISTLTSSSSRTGTSPLQTDSSIGLLLFAIDWLPPSSCVSVSVFAWPLSLVSFPRVAWCRTVPLPSLSCLFHTLFLFLPCKNPSCSTNHPHAQQSFTTMPMNTPSPTSAPSPSANICSSPSAAPVCCLFLYVYV
jgi:hypothetical protein